MRPGRLGIVEMMWEIVFADGRVNEFEDNLMWRAADLLGRFLARPHRAAPAGRRRKGESNGAWSARRAGRGLAMSIFKPVTVVTGASVGIGAALARVFARTATRSRWSRGARRK